MTRRPGYVRTWEKIFWFVIVPLIAIGVIIPWSIK